MDDYISKPIDADQLIASVEFGIGQPEDQADDREDETGGDDMADAVDTMSMVNTTTQQRSTFDLQAALQRVRGKEALLKEMLATLVRDLPHELAQIDSAITNRDAQAIERTAHRLRGASSTLCAEDLTTVLSKIEDLARARDFAAIALAVDALHLHAEKLLAAMKNYLVTI